MQLKSRQYLFFWVAGGFLLIVLGLLAAFQFYFIPKVEAYVRNKVEVESQQLYSLDNLSINWLPFQRKLVLQDIKLDCQHTLHSDSDSSKLCLNMELPKIEVRRFKPWEIYREKLVNLNEVSLLSPKIVVHPPISSSESPAEALPPDSLLSRIYTAIEEASLSDIKIDVLRLENGTIEFRPLVQDQGQAFYVKDVELAISDINASTDNPPSKIDPIWMKHFTFSGNIEDYTYWLPNKAYRLECGKIHLASADSAIRLSELKLVPHSQKENEEQNTPIVEIPELVLEGINWEEVINQDLIARSLAIYKPIVRNPGRDNKTPVSVNIDSLLKNISQKAVRLHLDTFFIHNGSFLGNKISNNLLPNNFDQINFGLGSVHLDSSITSIEKLQKSYKHISFNTGAFQFLTKSNDYHLAGERLALDQKTNCITVSKMKISPQGKQKGKVRRDGGSLVSISLPRFSFSNLNLHRLAKHKQLIVGDIHLMNPKVSIEQFALESQLKKDTVRPPLNLYQAVEPIFRGLYVGKFRLEKGSLEFNHFLEEQPVRLFSTNDLSLGIDNFRLDKKISESKPFEADAFNLQVDAQGYQYIMPDSSYALSVAEVGINSSDSLITLDTLVLTPLKQAPLAAGENRFKVVIPRFQLSGLDLYQAYMDSTLSLDSLKILYPKVEHYASPDPNMEWEVPNINDLAIADKIKPFLKSLEVASIKVEKAEYTHHNQSLGDTMIISLPFESFQIIDLVINDSVVPSPERPLYAENIRFELGEINQKLPDQLQGLNIHRISYESLKGQVQVDSFSLTSYQQGPQATESLNEQNKINIQIPQIFCNGLDLYRLFEERRLEINDVQFRAPDVQLITNPNQQKEKLDSLRSLDLYSLIQTKLAGLKLGKLLITDGILGFRTSLESPDEAFTADDIFVLVKDFEIDSLSQAKSDQLFYAKDIDIGIDADNYTFVLPDSTYELTIGHLGLSTNDKRLYAEDIFLKPRKDNPKLQSQNQVWEINIPNLQAKGVNPEELYFDKIVRLDQLRISRPKIRMEHQHFAKDTAKSQLDVYQLISQNLSELHIKDLFLQQANFQEVKHPSDTTKALEFGNFSVRAMDFKPDSLGLYRKGRYFYSRDVLLSLKDYVIPVPKMIYELKLGEVGLHTSTNQVYARDLEFAPKYDTETFFEKFGWVKDDVVVKARDAKLERVQVYDLIDKGRFEAGHVLIEGFEVRAEKDRHYPQNPNKRPPMPQDIIKNLKNYVKLDTISIASGDVKFYEHIPDLKRPSFLQLRNMDITITGVTNDSALIENNHIIRMGAQVTLMQTGQLEMNFVFPMADTSNAYRFYGKASRMNMNELNSIIEQTAFVNVSDGTMERCFFEVDARRRFVKGERKFIYRGKMRLYYDDLKVAVINKKHLYEDDTFDQKKMASFLANTLVRSKNPRGAFLRIGKIDYEREEDKGVVGHWVKSLVSGIRSSVGLQKKDEREKFNVIKKLKDLNKKKKKKKKLQVSP